MTTPLPVASSGGCLVQGRAMSGRRMVENTFTTAFSASWLMVSALLAFAFAAAPVTGTRHRASNDRTSVGNVRVIKARLHLEKRGGARRARF